MRPLRSLLAANAVVSCPGSKNSLSKRTLFLLFFVLFLTKGESLNLFACEAAMQRTFVGGNWPNLGRDDWIRPSCAALSAQAVRWRCINDTVSIWCPFWRPRRYHLQLNLMKQARPGTWHLRSTSFLRMPDHHRAGAPNRLHCRAEAPYLPFSLWKQCNT